MEILSSTYVYQLSLSYHILSVNISISSYLFIIYQYIAVIYQCIIYPLSLIYIDHCLSVFLSPMYYFSIYKCTKAEEILESGNGATEINGEEGKRYKKIKHSPMNQLKPIILYTHTHNENRSMTLESLCLTKACYQLWLFTCSNS